MGKENGAAMSVSRDTAIRQLPDRGCNIKASMNERQ